MSHQFSEMRTVVKSYVIFEDVHEINHSILGLREKRCTTRILNETCQGLIMRREEVKLLAPRGRRDRLFPSISF
jgi:hypothetical protein